uniref:TSP1_CCN domain-containing protein n=1 Tax=Elaeophora elaphi TaxID=1147741 RepID=A0A0R3RXZ0_9BILA
MNSKATSGTFTKSSSNEVKDSGSTADLQKKSSEELSPIPDNAEVEQPSESVPEQMEFLVGEDTEELSDVTDPEIYSTRSFTPKSRGDSTSHLFVWFGRIYPLMRNKKVRYLTVVNAILLLINFLMLLSVLAFLLNQIILAFRISSIMNDQPSPCIFTYEAWSSCSASCWDGTSKYPQMQRYVNKSSIVQARGGYEPECPEDLDSRVDFAPCNTFRCPTNLSQYPFIGCYYKNSVEESLNGCYRIRNVPLDDRLIFMDADLTQNCSEEECKSIKSLLF